MSTSCGDGVRKHACIMNNMSGVLLTVVFPLLRSANEERSAKFNAESYSQSSTGSSASLLLGLRPEQGQPCTQKSRQPLGSDCYESRDRTPCSFNQPREPVRPGNQRR